MGVTDLSCYDTDGDGLVLAYINIPETVSTNMRSGNADVIGDGVRLRNSPTTTATILELMYNGESVYIDYANMANSAQQSDFLVLCYVNK